MAVSGSRWQCGVKDPPAARRDHPMGAGGRMFWNMVDVRDTARAHRLCLEVGRGGCYHRRP